MSRYSRDTELVDLNLYLVFGAVQSELKIARVTITMKAGLSQWCQPWEWVLEEELLPK